MDNRHSFLLRLDLPDDADERSIRRAYARELKLIDQENDAAGFQDLREAYDVALMWSRHVAANDMEQAADADSAIAAPPPASAATEPAAHADAAPAQHEAAVDHAAQGGEVFAGFMARCQSLSSERPIIDANVWQRELQASLADERLINILARDIYEHHVAHLLVAGWQPGHEALLVAAIKVFNWDQDRRRVLSLGQAGAVLDAAIDQRTMFELQTDAEQNRQRLLVQRLRELKEPGTRELMNQIDTLETMIARFPDWLALIVSVPAALHWRELNGQIPGWRRKLAFIGRRKPAEASYEKQGSSFNWGWLVFWVILGLARFASHTGSDSGSPPARSAAAVTDAANLIDLGNQQLDQGNNAQAAATYTRAIERNPENDMAYADRALANYQNEDYYQAKRDSEKAVSMNHANPVAYRARGLVAMHEHSYTDALADFTRSIQLDPNNAFTYYQRGLAYEAGHVNAQARNDAEQAIRLQPKINTGAYALIARTHLAGGDKKKAAEQAEALLAAMPDNHYSYLTAARIYHSLGRTDAALATLDRGYKAAPDISLHLLRSELLPRSDVAGRLAAIQKALALNAREPEALRLRMTLEYDTGNYKAAIDTATTALADMSADSQERAAPLMGRGIAYARLGQHAAATADFTAARSALGPNAATAANNICWYLAIREVELSTALNNCNAALTLDPKHVQALDSKGFVLLRMGRYADSVAAYDAALALRPALPHSLYGRGIAQRRLGKRSEGDADIKAALAINNNIAATFAGYGVKQ
ncbi:tetratricopeptide repeat protein [Duganella sp. HH105]|uniref:tetratricopeptide repeat protein n=1 Tax=Duganella sp. HH105 TaxID=1781067 RepID=UPI000877B12A|nr:tetratricopeptide repeat protein [Duganella sp. HH105]OEZ57703.1 photosystem I assembly protein Ycf3 [Duganella sp. HH105]